MVKRHSVSRKLLWLQGGGGGAGGCGKSALWELTGAGELLSLTPASELCGVWAVPGEEALIVVTEHALWRYALPRSTGHATRTRLVSLPSNVHDTSDVAVAFDANGCTAAATFVDTHVVLENEPKRWPQLRPPIEVALWSLTSGDWVAQCTASRESARLRLAPCGSSVWRSAWLSYRTSVPEEAEGQRRCVPCSDQGEIHGIDTNCVCIPV